MAEAARASEILEETVEEPFTILRPTLDHTDDIVDRPKKRRKTSDDSPQQASSPTRARFVPLLGGQESIDYVRRRQDLCQEAVAQFRARLAESSKGSSTHVVEATCKSIEADQTIQLKELLPCTAVLFDASMSSGESPIEGIVENFQNSERIYPVVLTSADCTQLKGALSKVTTVINEQDAKRNGLGSWISTKKHYPYDLQQFVFTRDVDIEDDERRIVCIFPAAESIGSVFLDEFLVHLTLWLNKLSISVLFGISTSVDLLLQRIPARVLHKLQFSVIDGRSNESEQDAVFERLICEPSAGLILGPDVVEAFAGNKRRLCSTPSNYPSIARYALLSHCFANPLSALAKHDASEEPNNELTPLHCQVLRQLPSFRHYCESLTREEEESNRLERESMSQPDNRTQLRSLLQSDDHLRKLFRNHTKSTHKALRDMLGGIKVLAAIKRYLLPSSKLNSFHLYIEAFNGSPSFQYLVKQCAISMKSASHDQVQYIRNEIITEPPWSKSRGYDVTAPFSSVYTDLIPRVVSKTIARALLMYQWKLPESFRRNCAELFKRPVTLLFSEIFLCTPKATLSPTFNPSPRTTLFHALAHPHDYLDCTCCSAVEALGPRQPDASIVYQLVMESGALVNVWDLWCAFKAVKGRGSGDADSGRGSGDEEGEGEDVPTNKAEQEWKVGFYRGLAVMRMLGLIKSSGRRKDCFARVTWDGL